ncbi:MAG: hypothetical protein ACRBCT_01070 [Alphaproteobacteria bacterium]
MDDKNLDAMLARRVLPEPPSNLSALIIEAAKSVEQDRPWYKRRLLPRFPVIDVRAPALAFSVVTLLVVSAVFVNVEPPQQALEDDVSLAFYLDDIVYAGDI